MKTKITTVAVVLAVAMVATVVAANLSGSARTIPMPKEGDPVPGVILTIGTLTATTNSDGVGTIANVPPGPTILTFKRGHGIATGRSGGCFGMYVKSTGGGKDASAEWKDTSKEFKMNIVVEGRGPQSVTVKAKFKLCSST